MTDERTADTDRESVIQGSDRRAFLRTVGGTAVTAASVSGVAAADDGDDGGDEDGAPTVPLTHGVASGEVTAESAVVWTRAAREATVLVGYSTDEAFSDAEVQATEVTAETDFTGQVRLRGLESGTRYYYRVVAVEPDAALPGADPGEWDVGELEDAAGGPGRGLARGRGGDVPGLGDERGRGRAKGGSGAGDVELPIPSGGHSDAFESLREDSVGGTFVTAPAADEDGSVTFAWSGDTWGYGDDPVEPPYEGLAAIAEQQPDFFLYLGDTIYADAQTPAGKITENTRLDEALPIYRGKYKEMRVPPTDVADRSNLLKLLSATSVYAMWDDHEVINNFAGPIEPLMPFGRRAFAEYWPLDRGERRGWDRDDDDEEVRLYGSFRWGKHVEMFVLDTRQYRDPNVETAEKSLLGEEQLEWLKSSLADSDATWKVIASPAPMGHPSDTWATPADRTGYEAELQEVVRLIETEPVSNVVTVAGDVHHSQVGAYDPDGDGEFEFHEAIAGPLGAPSGEPSDLYGPLNPTEFFAKGGYFNYGTVEVDESGETLTIAIRDAEGTEQFSKTVEATEAEPAETPERIESAFDEDADGWLVSNNGGSNAPEHHASGGNPGGHISDAENQGGVAWYYQAPFRFLGDREAFYGGTISFDIRQEQTDRQFDAEPTEGGDVMLRSGERTLVYEFRGPNANPSTEWRTFEVPLTAEAGWIDLQSDQPLATEETLRSVLADLETLRIRGEYRSGADRSYLDNVVLSRE